MDNNNQVPISNIDLTQVQRMSKIGVLILFIQQLLMSIRAFGFLILYWVFKYFTGNNEESQWMQYIGYGVLAILLIIIVVAVLKYKNYKFYIDEEAGTFVLETGVFSKEKTIIQLEKIFQVNIKQNVWHQVFDVYELEIETAGSLKAEVNIQALDEPLALVLKQALKAITEPIISEHTEQDTEIEAAKFNTNKRVLGNANIAKAALFSHYGDGLRVAFGVIVLLFSQFREWTGIFSNQSDEEWIVGLWDSYVWQELLVVLALVLLVPFMVNVYRFVIRFYNASYEIRGKEELHITYGLLTIQEKLFKVRKLQDLQIESNSILHKLGLKFFTLSQSDNTAGAKGKSLLVFPGLSDDLALEMEHLFYGQEVKLGEVFKPLKIKLLLNTLSFIIFFTAIYLPLWLWTEMPIGVHILAAMIFVFVLIHIFFRFKHEALYVHPDFIVKKTGFLRRKYVIIQPHKIQNHILRQRIWKPKHGQLYLYTASSAIILNAYDFQMLKKISEGYHNQNIQSPQAWM